jgi:hypothetical protein
MEICIGNHLRKLYTKNEVSFDDAEKRWYIHPTQEETMAFPVGKYHAIARIRYMDVTTEQIIGVDLGEIEVVDSISEVVI